MWKKLWDFYEKNPYSVEAQIFPYLSKCNLLMQVLFCNHVSFFPLSDLSWGGELWMTFFKHQKHWWYVFGGWEVVADETCWNSTLQWRTQKHCRKSISFTHSIPTTRLQKYWIYLLAYLDEKAFEKDIVLSLIEKLPKMGYLNLLVN